MLSVAFLLLVFFVVQAALYYHARNVIKAEAEGVARAVRAPPPPRGGPPAARIPSVGAVRTLANAEAVRQWNLLDDGGDTTSRPVVQADIVGFDQVRVTITAKPIMIIPSVFGGDLEISATAGGPFEVFKRSGDD